MGQGTDEASPEVACARVGAESEVERALEQEPEERASLSEKERQSEEVNEKDNCSASSISSSSSTLEREEKEDKLSRDKGTGNTAPVNTFQGTLGGGLGLLATEVTLLVQLAQWPVSPVVWR